MLINDKETFLTQEDENLELDDADLTDDGEDEEDDDEDEKKEDEEDDDTEDVVETW